MQDKTFRATHVNDLKFLQDYIQKIDSSLSGLSHTVGAEIKELGASLTKTPGLHHSRYLPKPPRPPASFFSSSLFTSLLGGLSKNQNSPTYTMSYQSSTGQMWADLAAGISKAVKRNL